MIIGIDVDGVLADFNTAFIHRVIDVTGRDLFPPRPFDIPTWNYPEYYGYETAEVTETWNDLKADDMFWQGLPEYPETQEMLYRLSLSRIRGNDIYFITNRMGTRPKQQTENWLRDRSFIRPTVLLTGKKDLAAQTLDLDMYLDDKWENAADVAFGTMTQSFLLTRPWNVNHLAETYGVTRVASVLDFLDRL